MKTISRFVLAGMFGTVPAAMLLAQAPAITMTPASPQILAGQTQQFSATSPLTPTAIAGGGYHTCLMFPDATLRCAGANSWGQLGNGGFANAASQLIPLLEASPTLERVEFTSPVTKGRDREQFRLRATWERRGGAR